ncbi:hypothetical protein A3Q56_04481 [Intoshia linei]|uniref:Uncharacterized protein n=1 Tax=Intoshia linei TaxID=1819745 RepID=A0A177B2D9_9BILA|nr:hypothetical protein A3Q56_04481 [Intoshia linei]
MSHNRKFKQDVNRPKIETLEYSFISRDNCEILAKFKSFEEVKLKLQSILLLKQTDTNILESIQLDLYTEIVIWAKREQTIEKTPGTIGTVLYTVKKFIEYIKDKNNRLCGFIAMYKDLFSGVSPTTPAKFFPDIDEAFALKLILYTNKTFFNHYNLMKSCFSESALIQIVGRDLEIEIPPFEGCLSHVPLEEGILEKYLVDLDSLTVESTIVEEDVNSELSEIKSLKPNRKLSSVSNKSMKSTKSKTGNVDSISINQDLSQLIHNKLNVISQKIEVAFYITRFHKSAYINFCSFS